MDEKSHLTWSEESRKQVFDCKIFTISESNCRSPDKDTLYTFSIINAKDWAIVVPVIGGQFVMVRQWRHGAQCLSLEFPGGVFEPGENAEEAAAREL